MIKLSLFLLTTKCSLALKMMMLFMLIKNILVGHMAVIGPRPLLVQYLPLYNERQKRRHEVRPGLSGLAQVNGRNNITWEEKMEYDLAYIDNGITLWGDIKIIFQTIKKVLKKSDTVREGTATDIDFGDWLMLEGKVDRHTYDQKQTEAKELLNIS